MPRLLLLAVLLSVPGVRAEEPTPDYPKAGSDLPGPFSPYIVTGPRKGNFHCLVSHHDLSPVAMVVIRGTEVPKALKDLLVDIESAIVRNPNTRLAGFVVCLTDKLKDIVRDDDAREDVEKQLEKLEGEAMLKRMTLAIATKTTLQKYKIPDKTEVVIILYNRYRVVAYHELTRDQLTAEKAKEILGEVAEKLGAKR